MTKMSEQQKQYAKAKAIYLTLKDERCTAIQQWEAEHGKVTQESSEAFYTDMGRVETKIGYWKALDNLTAAEKVMVEWAISKMQPLATEEQMRQFQSMVDKLNTYELMPKQREHLIDLSFRLHAS